MTCERQTENETLVLRVLQHPETRKNLSLNGNQGICTYAHLSVEEVEVALTALVEKGLAALHVSKRKGRHIMYFAVDGKLTVEQLWAQS